MLIVACRRIDPSRTNVRTICNSNEIGSDKVIVTNHLAPDSGSDWGRLALDKQERIEGMFRVNAFCEAEDIRPAQRKFCWRKSQMRKGGELFFDHNERGRIAKLLNHMADYPLPHQLFRCGNDQGFADEARDQRILLGIQLNNAKIAIFPSINHLQLAVFFTSENEKCIS